MRWWQIRGRDADLQRELRSDLELEEEEQRERGLTPEETRYAAQRALGNAVLIREHTHEAWGWAPLERLWQDLHYTFRQLRRSPGFASVCLITLALGIGANTAMFSVVQGVILAPLPFPQANRLVLLWEKRPGVPKLLVSYPNFKDWERSSRSFSALSALRFHNVDLTAPGKAEHLTGIQASSAFLRTLRIKPALGRDFTASEDQANAAPVALISDNLWRERFASNPRVVGQSVDLDGRTFTVIGVLPPEFQFLANADVITPLRPTLPVILNDRSVEDLGVVARLKPDVTKHGAEAALNTIQQELDREYPNANESIGVTATSLIEEVLGNVKGTILLLFGSVCLVLLIACANLANLLLARSMARSHEFGVRTALGASRGRVMRQLLTESIVLSLAGGALGVVIADFGLRILLAALPHTLPRASNIGLHLPVLMFTAGASITVGILFGLAPVFQYAGSDVRFTLQSASRATTGGRHRMLGRLVVAQFALTLVLMAGAGLLLRSVSNLWRVNPGFNMKHVISFHVGLSPSLTTTSARTRAAWQQLLAKIDDLPGVEAADLTNIVPLSGGDNGGPFWIGTNQPASLQEAPHALYFWTGPDYLKTMRIPLLGGRFFTPADRIGSEKVVVIDSVLARKFFPHQNPVGRTLTVAHWGAARIVGVVGHVRNLGLDDPGTYLPQQIYIPAYQLPDSIGADFLRTLTVVVRSALPPADLMPAIRKVVHAFAPDQPVYDVKTVDEFASQSMATRNIAILLLGVFAGLALLLSAIGIYGVVSYSVTRRTQEIGIRMALGADRSRVFRMIVSQAIGMATAGLGIGITAVMALVRLLPGFSHLLYGVGRNDPLTLFCVSAGLLLVAVAACLLPASRAMRTDPMRALRTE